MAKATPPGPGPDLETVTSADGTEIAFAQAGSGPPLVLVHCATGDHHVWDIGDVRSRLAQHTTVYAIDRRGRGGSGDSEEYESKREFEDVAAVVDSIDEEITLLGHSAGGFYSLEAALRTDNLNGMILYEPAMPVNGYKIGSEESRAEMMSLLEAGKNEQAYIVFLEDIAEWTPDELNVIRSAPVWEAYTERFPTLLPKYGRIREYEFDPVRLADITTPTLLLSGSKSGEWAKDTTQKLAEVLPNNRVITFDGHGHAANLTTPDRFIDEVLAFLRELN